MSSENAVLVTVQLDPRFSKGSAIWPIEDEANELKELAVSSGCKVAAEVSVRRHQPVSGTFIGSGKLDEIHAIVHQNQAQTAIFNHELSPAQQRNIEETLQVKTVDRTQLILDIFAQRAKSQEGKVQVELAQLRYLMPRLVGQGVLLSRLGGGIGSRGPGEQKLEVDRRRIRLRITRLDEELKKLGRRREAMRERRKETEVPVVALVGYTNAGKTTLLNRLTGTVATAKNQLFTTLDPLARRLHLPSGETVVMTDTVGFLHHLPHHLIEAFKATLEEARDADIVLHVIDAAHPLIEAHVEAVEEVLRMLELKEKPLITVLNKKDRVTDKAKLESFERIYAPAVSVSAATGEDTEALLELIGSQLKLLLVEPTRLRISTQQSEMLARLYRLGQVLKRKPLDDGEVEITARIPAKLKTQLAPYIISS